MYKDLFPTAKEVTYLDTAAEGLPHPECANAFQLYAQIKARGTPGRIELHKTEAAALDLAARLLGTDSSNVTFLASASDALSLLATSLELGPRDQVVISELEFPSNVLPWVRLKQKGVEVVVVSGKGGKLDWEEVAENISPRTRLVSLSLVSYKTGAYLSPVQKIASAAEKVGALVSIDATQALGRCPVSIEGIDYLMSSSFKWLLGPHGLAVVYASPRFRARLESAMVGWYSVKNIFSEKRFESYELKDGAARLPVGMPNFPSIFALKQSLEFLLRIGVENIHHELQPLVASLRAGLARLGLDLLTPAGPESASGIVAFAHPQAEEIGTALQKERVTVWAGDGRVRASIHLYNDSADIGRYLSTLEGILSSKEFIRA
ncbi:MAG: aminotransferase class V-fold PLP-dependent enzyme [Acidobacteria bacterium]|nr:MAG: aminotransferase class V-fold PLP-dependent enzyme [Acidobacteriota bacterium]